MSDVVADRRGGFPAGLDFASMVTPFWRLAAGAGYVRVGVAGLVSAAVAAAICASIQHRPAAPEPLQPFVLRPTLSASANPSAIANVAWAWTEDWALLFDATGPGRQIVPPKAWVPAGGLSTLVATRFPLASKLRMPDVQVALAEPAVPLPPPAPRAAGAAPQTVARAAPLPIEPQVASLPPQPRQPGTFDFFRRLFGDKDRAAKEMLAANPKTALYDIAKRVVYLPDGERLEAHSGYGKWMDDTESAARKDVGVTPPNVYAVSFRETPFHGVRALRLTPVGDGNMYGRDGILAHSYLLGEAGASNGCVSLRDYDKFLQAYEDGKFDRIIVLRSADEPSPSQVASSQSDGT
jgi:hypothetical protein